MKPADESVIAWIGQANTKIRIALCALARSGKALMRDEPERGRELLEAVYPNPIYKGMRVQFDLLEIEDLMLDGPLPTDLGDAAGADAIALGRLASILSVAWTEGETPDQPPDTALDARKLLTYSDMARDPTMPLEPPPVDGWPELDAADYLYDLVVLGILRRLSRIAETSERNGQPISASDVVIRMV